MFGQIQPDTIYVFKVCYYKKKTAKKEEVVVIELNPSVSGSYQNNHFESYYDE